MGMVKLEKKKQKRLKVVSKIIYILAMLGKIFTRVAVFFVILGMFLVIPILQKVDVNKVDDVIEISVDGKATKIEETEDGKLSMDIDGQKVDLGKMEEKKDFYKVFDVLADNSKEKLIASFSVTMIFAIIELILVSIVLSMLEDLFRNIYNEDTPFIQENVTYIRKMTYYMIATTVLNVIAGLIVNAIISKEFNMNFGYGIMELLFIYVLGHIFEYGYELQLDSEAKIYGDDIEEK